MKKAGVGSLDSVDSVAIRTRSRRETVAATIILIATVVGLGAALRTIGGSHLAAILQSLRGMGVDGFAGYCLYSAAVFLPLGLAWLVAMGEAPRRVGWFAWARMLREAASDLLPFSQIGGIVVSTSMLASRGFDSARIHASLVVDLTTELAGQLLFTLLGIAIAAVVWMGSPSTTALEIGVLCSLPMLGAILIVSFTVPRWLPRMAGGIAARLLPGSTCVLETIALEVAAIQARPLRMALSFSLNLTSWILSAAGAWIALRLMHVDFPLLRILSLEALIFALRSVAFMVPGGIGVQEAAYVLVAPHFGLSLDAVVTLALAKRARDLAIGVPTLIAWQLAEARHLVARPRRGTANPLSGTP